MPAARESRPPKWLATLTLVVTNLIKLGGLGVSMEQVFFKPSAQPLILAVAAFMMAGAQGIEEAALHFFTRFFAPDPRPRSRPRRGGRR